LALVSDERLLREVDVDPSLTVERHLRGRGRDSGPRQIARAHPHGRLAVGGDTDDDVLPELLLVVDADRLEAEAGPGRLVGLLRGEHARLVRDDPGDVDLAVLRAIE